MSLTLICTRVEVYILSVFLQSSDFLLQFCFHGVKQQGLLVLQHMWTFHSTLRLTVQGIACFCAWYLKVLFCSLKFTFALVVDNLQTQLSVHPYRHTSETEKMTEQLTYVTLKITKSVGQTCKTTDQSRTSHSCPCLHAVLQRCQWVSVFSGLARQHLFQFHLHLVQPLTKQPTSPGHGQPSHPEHSYFSKSDSDGLLFFKGLKLFFQLQHLVEAFSSPSLTVLIIHVFRS